MLAGQVMWLGSNMKMNELWYRVQVKVYRHICNEVRQSPWDSEAGTECRDSWEPDPHELVTESRRAK